MSNTDSLRADSQQGRGNIQRAKRAVWRELKNPPIRLA